MRSLPPKPRRMSIAGGTTTSTTATPELIFVHLLIGSPRRTRRTSPSVMPQLARLPVGIRPTTSTTSSPAFVTFDTAPLVVAYATKNHCSTKGSPAACLVKNRRRPKRSSFQATRVPRQYRCRCSLTPAIRSASFCRSSTCDAQRGRLVRSGTQHVVS